MQEKLFKNACKKSGLLPDTKTMKKKVSCDNLIKKMNKMKLKSKSKKAEERAKKYKSETKEQQTKKALGMLKILNNTNKYFSNKQMKMISKILNKSLIQPKIVEHAKARFEAKKPVSFKQLSMVGKVYPGTVSNNQYRNYVTTLFNSRERMNNNQMNYYLENKNNSLKQRLSKNYVRNMISKNNPITNSQLLLYKAANTEKSIMDYLKKRQSKKKSLTNFQEIILNRGYV